MKSCIIPLLVAAAVAIGCGEDGGGDGIPTPGGEAASGRSAKNVSGVRATAEAFARHLRDEKYGDACDLFTDEARQQVAREFEKFSDENEADDSLTCAGAMAFARSFLGKETLDKTIKQIDTAEVTIRGDRAEMEPILDDDDRGQYVYRDGRWYIDADK